MRIRFPPAPPSLSGYGIKVVPMASNHEKTGSSPATRSIFESLEGLSKLTSDEVLPAGSLSTGGCGGSPEKGPRAVEPAGQRPNQSASPNFCGPVAQRESASSAGKRSRVQIPVGPPSFAAGVRQSKFWRPTSAEGVGIGSS